jgi:hypothetical protein
MEPSVENFVRVRLGIVTVTVRNRAKKIGCRVRVFTRKYHIGNKAIRFSLVDEHGELYASNLAELRDRIRLAEKRAPAATPGVSITLPLLP